jgi:hypothetical protein
MSQSLSGNAQAILLLTAPLNGGGRSRAADDILTPAEYRRVAQHLRLLQNEPADLVGPEAAALLEECRGVVDQPGASTRPPCAVLWRLEGTRSAFWPIVSNGR